MTTKVEIENAISQNRIIMSDAVDLFSQQIWCWGRDILRTEGNWLIHQGFDVMIAPTEKARSKKIYSLSLPNSKNVILRGFGVLFSDQKLGTIFVPRYDFQPKYTKSTELETPPWDVRDISELKFPVRSEIKYCISMLIDLIDWIIEYENDIQSQLGIKYRIDTLCDWGSGKKRVIPAEDIIPMWVKIKNSLQETQGIDSIS